jgi:hypothetical protein
MAIGFQHYDVIRDLLLDYRNRHISAKLEVAIQFSFVSDFSVNPEWDRHIVL